MIELGKILFALACTLAVGYGSYRGLIRVAYRWGRLTIEPVDQREIRQRLVQHQINDPVWPYDSRSL